MSSGNSVADYKVRYEYCDLCNGYKTLSMKKSDLIGLFRKLRMLYREAMSVYRTWQQRNGVIDCPECGGNGMIEIIE